MAERELSLYLYAYPDPDNDISDEITCVILDEYIDANHLHFDKIRTKKKFIEKAEKLAIELKAYIASTDIAAALEAKPIDEVELVVEEVDGPVVEQAEWVVWERPKKKKKK